MRQSQFNRATDALRQSGSSFKPFVYLAALLDGYTPDRHVVDGPVSVGDWSPKNYTGKYAGRTTLTNALAHSYNSIPVKLMIDIGRKAIIETAHRAGIKGELENWAPMVLGTSALSLMDLTTGYATFAAGGKLSATLCRAGNPQAPMATFSTAARKRPKSPRQVRAGGKDRRAELDAVRRGQDRHRPPG